MRGALDNVRAYVREGGRHIDGGITQRIYHIGRHKTYSFPFDPYLYTSRLFNVIYIVALLTLCKYTPVYIHCLIEETNMMELSIALLAGIIGAALLCPILDFITNSYRDK